MTSIQAAYEQTARMESMRASGEIRTDRSDARGLVVCLAVAAFALIAALVAMSAAVATPADALSDGHQTISTGGVGDAKIGSTKAQLESQLGAGWELVEDNAVLVDLYGYDVMLDGEHQFYALGGLGETRLTVFVVDTDGYATAEGVGPGMLLADAEAIYGDATLSYNVDNESREFVNFENGPEGRIFFRAQVGDDIQAGVYPDADTFETTEYEEGATIWAVWVACADGIDCPELAVTGPRKVGHTVLAAMLLVALGVNLAVLSRSARQ